MVNTSANSWSASGGSAWSCLGRSGVRRGKAVTRVWPVTIRVTKHSHSIFVFDRQESQQVSLFSSYSGLILSCSGDHLLIMYECSCPNKNSLVAPCITRSFLMSLFSSFIYKACQSGKSVITGTKFSETFLLSDLGVKTIYHRTAPISIQFMGTAELS